MRWQLCLNRQRRLTLPLTRQHCRSSRLASLCLLQTALTEDHGTVRGPSLSDCQPAGQQTYVSSHVEQRFPGDSQTLVLDNRSTSISKASDPPMRPTGEHPRCCGRSHHLPRPLETQISSRTSTLRQHLSLISKARRDSIHVLNLPNANSCNQTPRSTVSPPLFLICCTITSIASS